MGTFSRIRAITVNTLCILVCVVAVAFIVPAAFGLQRYVIAGSSMTGSIPLGSIAYEEVVPVEELAVGDVITYVPPAESGIRNLVTHRIVSIDGRTFRTKGDANADVDPWTFELTAATQPRVLLHVPLAGHPLLALQDRETRMLLIGGPAGLVFLLALGELIGRRRGGEEPVPAATVQQLPCGAVRRVLVPAQPTTSPFDRQPVG